MDFATSRDGTRIAFEQTGGGAPIVIVGGAFSTAAAGAPLAAALDAAGYDGVVMDRRARGESGDSPGYSPECEVEDLTAVLNAVGGDAAVLGHSSGAMLALLAASEGAPINHLFLSEPPFLFGRDEPSEDLPDRLQALVDAGRPEEAVTTFQREGIGLTEDFIERIRTSPMFEQLVPLAQSTVYDARLSRSVSTPTASMTGVSQPVTILRGVTTFPVIMAAAERLASVMPHAVLVTVPESHDHFPDPVGTAREVGRRMPVQ